MQGQPYSAPAHVPLCLCLEPIACEAAEACDHRLALCLIRWCVVTVLACCLCARKAWGGVKGTGSSLASKAEAAGWIA